MYQLRGHNCTVVYTDVAGFSGGQRSGADRLAVMHASALMTRLALAPFWESCLCADRGDGMVVVVPPSVPTGEVLTGLQRVLPGELRLHNAQHPPGRQIQLRVAVDVGPVTAGNGGVDGNPIIDGDPIIQTARMLQAQALKLALAAAGSPLGIIASAFVFNAAVRNNSERLGAGQYMPVQVRVKEVRIQAFYWLADAVGDDSQPGAQ